MGSWFMRSDSSYNGPLDCGDDEDDDDASSSNSDENDDESLEIVGPSSQDVDELES